MIDDGSGLFTIGEPAHATGCTVGTIRYLPVGQGALPPVARSRAATARTTPSPWGASAFGDRVARCRELLSVVNGRSEPAHREESAWAVAALRTQDAHGPLV